MSQLAGNEISLDQEASNLSLSAGSVSLNPQADLLHVTLKKREDARLIIAIMIVISLPFTVAAAFMTLWFLPKLSIEDLIKFIGGIISPVIGLIGAVAGFYFSESKHQENNADKAESG
jgi:flagellar basal body-associated protein FliL